MSTRGIYGIRKNGIDKCGYNHGDSYPDYLGKIMARFCSKHTTEQIGELFDRIVLVDQTEKPNKAEQEKLKADGIEFRRDGETLNWYSVMRKYQGELEKLNELKHPFLADDIEFIKNSLHCEYGYIINLDTNKLEFWQGWQNKPQPGNRYGEATLYPDEDERYRYYACRLAGEFDLPIAESDIGKIVEEMKRREEYTNEELEKLNGKQNEKENAISDYFENITKKSWTWGRMTSNEQERLTEFVNKWKDKFKGTAKARQEQFCMVYDAFLAGLGYSGFQWREAETEIN